MTNVNILIVEDDRIVAEDIKSSLKKLGFGVSGIVSYNEQVLEKIKECLPDLVLMDIILKGKIKGTETATQIQTQHNIPVVYLTAQTDENVLERIKVTEPFGYIVKPFEDRELNMTIEIALYKHKRAAEVLRESGEKFNSLYNNAVVGLFRTRISDGKLLEINQRYAELAGYSTIEECMESFSAGDSYVDPNVRNQIVQDLYKQGKVQDYEAQIKQRDGTKIWVGFSAQVYKEQGYLEGVLINITERKRTEEALLSEKLLAEEYINSLPGLFYVFDEHRLVRWNNKWNGVTGYSNEEIADMYGTDFFKGEDKTLIGQRMLKVFHEGTARAEAELITKDGLGIPYYFTGTRKNLNGKDYLIGLGIDITERKEAEEEKRKALEFVAEQSKHALIGQVAGKMAHDFNNVLMGIMGNAQLAIMNCDDENIKVKLEHIDKFSKRGRDITNTLISYSKDQETKQTCFKIEDKMELVLKMLEKDLTGIEVSRSYKPGIPELLADPGMIQDVLTNIIQNSIHAMSKTENPTLNLKAFSQDDMVYFVVEDNGCGIPKEHQDSIYTPSFTLKGSHDKTGSYKSEIKGTGYGMPNVKKYIVEIHKGDIFLESEVGKGTTITIALRVIKDHLSLNEKKDVMASQIYDMRRVLLVEDEHAIADVQYQILTDDPFNHIVSIAANGQMAIDSLCRNKFDIVSLDYMLPGNISGLDVYNHIRESDMDIPILFISGNLEFLESIKQLKEKDSNLEHLSKPVDNLEYVNKINELIGKSNKV